MQSGEHDHLDHSIMTQQTPPVAVLAKATEANGQKPAAVLSTATVLPTAKVLPTRETTNNVLKVMPSSENAELVDEFVQSEIDRNKVQIELMRLQKQKLELEIASLKQKRDS